MAERQSQGLCQQWWPKGFPASCTGGHPSGAFLIRNQPDHVLMKEYFPNTCGSLFEK